MYSFTTNKLVIGFLFITISLSGMQDLRIIRVGDNAHQSAPPGQNRLPTVDFRPSFPSETFNFSANSSGGNFNSAITRPFTRSEVEFRPNPTWSVTVREFHYTPVTQVVHAPTINVGCPTPTYNKVIDVQASIGQISQVLHECTSTKIIETTYERHLALNDLKIPHNAELNAAFQQVKYDIQKIMFASDGQYVGVKTAENAAAIKSIVNDFNKQLNAWGKHCHVDSAASNVHNARWENFSEKIRNHPFNKDLRAIASLCADNKFEQAAALVAKYEQLAKNNNYEDSCRYGIAHGIYYYRYTAQFNVYGVEKIYGNDPILENFQMSSGSIKLPNRSANEHLAQRHQVVQNLQHTFGLRNEQQIQTLLYSIADDIHNNDPIAVADKLAHQLHFDSQSAAIKDTYQKLYTPNGLLRLYNANQQTSAYGLPATIHNKNHAQDRVSLALFSQLNTNYNHCLDAVQKGLFCIEKSCQEGEHSSSYSSLAKDIAQAAYQVEKDPTILQANSFMQPINNPLYQQLQDQLIPVAAQLNDSINSSGSKQEKTDLQQTLYALHALWHDAVFDNHEPSGQALATILTSYQSTANTHAPFASPSNLFNEFLPLDAECDLITTAANEPQNNPPQSLNVETLQTLLNDEQLATDILDAMHKDPVFEMSAVQEGHDALTTLQETIFDRVFRELDERQIALIKQELPWLEKALKVGGLEFSKKTVDLGNKLCHPIQTAVDLIYNAGNLVKVLARLCATDFEFAIDHPELSHLAGPGIQDAEHIFAVIDTILNSRSEQLKFGIDIVFDLVTQAQIGKALRPVAKGLRHSIQGLTIAKNVPKIVQSTEYAEQINNAINFATKEITGINRLQKTLVQLARQREQEILTLHKTLPRTVDMAVKELDIRIACLSMQYGDATVKEAVSLFNTTEKALLKNIRTIDELEEITASLHKINSNSRWRSFKYDAAKNGKITVGSVQEAVAGIACEEQGLLKTLKRGFNEGEDFVENITNKSWDVKTPKKYALDGHHVLNQQSFFDSVKEALIGDPKEHLILDFTNLSNTEINDFFQYMKLEFKADEFKKIIVMHRGRPEVGVAYFDLFLKEN